MRIIDGMPIEKLQDTDYYLIDNGSAICRVSYETLAAFIANSVRNMINSTSEITDDSDVPYETVDKRTGTSAEFYVTGFGYVSAVTAGSYEEITDLTPYGISNINYDGQRVHSDEDYVIDNITSNGIYAGRRMHVTYYKNYYTITVDDGNPTTYIYSSATGDYQGLTFYYGEFYYHAEVGDWHRVAGYDVEVTTDDDDHSGDDLSPWAPYISPTYANRGTNVNGGEVFSTGDTAVLLSDVRFSLYIAANQRVTGNDGKIYRLTNGCTLVSLYYAGDVYHFYYDCNGKYVGYSVYPTEDGNVYEVTSLAVSSSGNGEVTLRWDVPTVDSDKNATLRICYKKGSAPTTYEDGDFVTTQNTGVRSITDIYDTGTYYFRIFTYKTGGGWSNGGNTVYAAIEYKLSPVKNIYFHTYPGGAQFTFTMPRAASEILIVYKQGSKPTSYNDGTVISTVHSYNEIEGLSYNTIYYMKIYSHNGNTYTQWTETSLNYALLDGSSGPDSGPEDWYKPNLNLSNGDIAFSPNPWDEKDYDRVGGEDAYYDD